MSDLTWQEKRNLEKILQMGGGYVLDFTNRSFQEFVTDCTGRNIFDEKYDYDSGSKANRLRAFWKSEPNDLVSKLLRCLLDYRRTMDSRVDEPALDQLCYAVVDRLNGKDSSVATQTKEPAVNPGSGVKESYDFFIAHAGGDLKPAEELYDLLASKARVFLDARCLLLGDNWNRVLPLAQKHSLVTVVLISSHSDSAYYESEEIVAAISLARKNPNTHRVVPIFLEDIEEVPYGLTVKHALSLSNSGGMSAVVAKLLGLLASLKNSVRSNTTEATQSSKPTATNVTHAPFVMCVRCGRDPGSMITCLGRFSEHDFKRFDGSRATVYCARCGRRPGGVGTCLGKYSEHEFQQFNAGTNEIHCKRCGKHPGGIGTCLGAYSEHDFQVL